MEIYEYQQYVIDREVRNLIIEAWVKYHSDLAKKEFENEASQDEQEKKS